ncbi:MAG: alpha/beta fold hydrolase [Vicinamibacterales bacterium]
MTTFTLATKGRLRYLEALPPPAARSRGTLVLIHAFPLSAHMWEPQLALSAGGWRVIAPFLRGFAGGADDPGTQSMNDFAADVVDLLDALHVTEAVICGLSLGGYVSMALLRLAPHYFKGLVLADTRKDADTPEGLAARTKMLALVREQGPAAVADQMIPKLLSPRSVSERPELVAQVRSLVMSNDTRAIEGAISAMMTREDSTEPLSTVRFPTLVVVGENDSLTPPPMAEALKNAVAGAHLVVIPEAGHLANLEQPRGFNDAVGDFLERRV